MELAALDVLAVVELLVRVIALALVMAEIAEWFQLLQQHVLQTFAQELAMRAALRVAMVIVLVLVTVLAQPLADGLLAKETAPVLVQEDVLLQPQLYHLVLGALENAKALVILNVQGAKMDVKVHVAADAAATVLMIAALLALVNLINKKKELTIK